MEIKEESIKNKNELEKETKERRAELQRYENACLSKEEALIKKQMPLRSVKQDLQRKKNSLAARSESGRAE